MAYLDQTTVDSEIIAMFLFLRTRMCPKYTDAPLALSFSMFHGL